MVQVKRDHMSMGWVPEFERFYRSEFSAVVAIVSGMVGRRWLAEELAQEAFLLLYRRWGEVSSHPSPEAWVRRVALNLARSSGRRFGAELRALIRLAPVATVPGPEPTFEPLWREARRLPVRQREVVALHYVDDLSIADVAGLLGISEGSVKTSLHRARHTLADRLGEEER